MNDLGFCTAIPMDLDMDHLPETLPQGNLHLAQFYKSGSQRARIISEAWVGDNVYCLACESDKLKQTPANTQARDFECGVCGHPYELKSSLAPFGPRIADGAYSSMIRRVNTGSLSSLLLLQYSSNWSITNVLAVHHAFITSSVIERRKPLSMNARRAGWVGCNILLGQIPPEGRIQLIENGLQLAKKSSRSRFAAIERLSSLSPLGRSWASTILSMLHRLKKEEFGLIDVYAFETELASLYPSNKNVRAKIRQQLQVLRDAGFLSFKSRGKYRFCISK